MVRKMVSAIVFLSASCVVPATAGELVDAACKVKATGCTMDNKTNEVQCKEGKWTKDRRSEDGLNFVESAEKECKYGHKDIKDRSNSLGPQR